MCGVTELLTYCRAAICKAAIEAPASILILCKELPQTVKPSLPQRSPLADPLLHHRKSRRHDPAGSHPAHFFRMHQPALLQHLQMLHHCGQRNHQRRRQARNRHRSIAKPLDDRATGRIAESMKHTVDPDSLTRLCRGPHWRTSSSPSASSRWRHPSSRIVGPSAPSKKAACSVKTSFVPSPVGTNSNVACEAEMRRPPSVMV